jgi:chemotaxis protein MotA
MDLATIIGIVMAFGAVFGGAALEGVHISALIQPTAAMIVLGGTFGATFVCFPLPAIINALKGVKGAFLPAKVDHEQVVKDIINYATKARRNGLISLEQEAQSARDPFIKKGISLVVDGIDPQKLRETLEADIMAYEDHTKHTVEFYEAAGGFSPTIGIIGAVLGLIHVMGNLSDTSKLGGGIAVAFVATIYGLIVANVLCLPIGTKLKIRMKEEVLRRVMILEGLIAIQNGENPHFIEQKLMAFVGGDH